MEVAGGLSAGGHAYPELTLLYDRCGMVRPQDRHRHRDQDQPRARAL
jgi:hypothetical protein